MSTDMFPQGFIDYMLARVDSIDKLAALIREVDSNGAGELAEALVDRGVNFPAADTDAGKTFEYATGLVGFPIEREGLTEDEAIAERLRSGCAIFRRQHGTWERVR